MDRVLTWLHVVAILVACGLIAYGKAKENHRHQSELWTEILHPTLEVAAVTAFVAGGVAMARRKGPTESIWLAISTVVAVLLMFIACGGGAIAQTAAR